MDRIRCPSRDYPSHVVNDLEHTIKITSQCGLHGMSICRLPDSLIGDEPSLGRIIVGQKFAPAGWVNASRRRQLIYPIEQRRKAQGTWSDEVSAHLNDSLALQFPRYTIRFKGVLTPNANDSLLFLPIDADSITYWTAKPSSLTQITLPNHWYALKLYDQGTVDGPSKVWYVWFHLDGKREITAWHNERYVAMRSW